MSVRLLGTIGIMWGLLQLVCNGSMLAPYLIAEHNDPMMVQLQSRPNLFAVVLVTIVTQLAMAMLLVLGSGFALMLQRFGRQAMVVAAAGMILVTVVQMSIAFSQRAPLAPPPATQPATIAPATTQPATTQSATAQPPDIVRYFAILAPFLQLIYPALVLIFLTRPHVKAAFEGKPQG